MVWRDRFQSRRVQILLYTFILLVSLIALILCGIKFMAPSGNRTSAQTEASWVSLHNEKRKYYQHLYNGQYVPLKWANSIADSAQMWADTLAKGLCQNYHHDPDNKYGENLAVIWGANDIDWVMSAWVDKEVLGIHQPFTIEHGHMTQVLWRATKYVGCAQSSNPKCNIYVCRYVKPGNCNIGKYSWLSDMMADNSPCGPDCPDEGCF